MARKISKSRKQQFTDAYDIAPVSGLGDVIGNGVHEVLQAGRWDNQPAIKAARARLADRKAAVANLRVVLGA